MKKIKRFVLASGINRLTDFEQMSLMGGTLTGNGCSGKEQSQCGGKCYSDGYEGTCGWVGAYSECRCVIIYVEPPTKVETLS